MCFSATASFIAGTTLCVVGVATLKRTEARTELPFAMIPPLFGIQPLTEGVIWLTFPYNAPLLKQMMTYVYSGFSHVSCGRSMCRSPWASWKPYVGAKG